MPEYLAPGVYVEEVSFRSKSIEGVPTSTTGFAGMTRTGPVRHAYLDLSNSLVNGPNRPEPRLITSFTEFERVYGGLESITTDDRPNYLAHAARAFFLNGGRRLYVSRVIPGDGTAGIATGAVRAVGGGQARWRARWPGAFGNVQVETRVVRTKNVNFTHPATDPVRAAWGPQARGAKDGTIVERFASPATGAATILSGTAPFAVADGQTLAVNANGTVTNVTVNATPATLTSVAAPGAVAAGDVLELNLNGVALPPVTFAAPDVASAPALATAIGAAVASQATVTEGGGIITIASRVSGTGSSLQVLGGTSPNVAALFPNPPTAGTGNVANVRAVTTAELVTLLGGAAGITVATQGGRVRLTSNLVGDASLLQVTGTAAGFGFPAGVQDTGTAVVSAAGPFALAEGQTLVVSVDRGPEQVVRFTQAQPAVLVSATAPGTVAAGDIVDLSIDGVPVSIALGAADVANAAALAAALGAGVGGAANVTQAANVITLTTTSTGTGSTLVVEPTSAASVRALFPTPARPGAGNVPNLGAPVPAADVVAALGVLRDATVSVLGTAVRIVSNADTVGASVQVRDTSTATALGFDTLVHGIRRNNEVPTAGSLYVVSVDSQGRQAFSNAAGPFVPGPDDLLQIVTLRVLVSVDGERQDVYDGLGAGGEDKRFIGRILQKDDPEDENATVWLELNDAGASASPELLLLALRGTGATGTTEVLSGGSDGSVITADDLLGAEADPDDPELKATGLEALGDIDDIAIVAAPDAATLEVPEVAAGYLIAHAEKCRYRIAVVDGPPGSSMTEIREFRGRFDSKYAALYHPWVEVLDPLERAAQGAPPRRLLLPPSGFVTGIYARSDIERGVHKAPANEIVRGLTQFEANINKARQDVLNPEGINALRFLEGRGNRVWGARTMSSDPEWKYVNVRRLFAYLEHSIDKGTQWAVFEPNNRRLWDSIRQSVEDFLLVLWRDGALLGDKPEEAYFVRCDRTTMTQNDLDNGRLICLVGVAPVKPAEFVIFRVGQWTADSKV